MTSWDAHSRHLLHRHRITHKILNDIPFFCIQSLVESFEWISCESPPWIHYVTFSCLARHENFRFFRFTVTGLVLNYFIVYCRVIHMIFGLIINIFCIIFRTLLLARAGLERHPKIKSNQWFYLPYPVIFNALSMAEIDRFLSMKSEVPVSCIW